MARRRHDAPEPILDEEARQPTLAGDEPGPRRRCLATRISGPPEGLIRFVLAPDGTVVPDLKRRLPGRGAWVTARAAEVREAARRNLFARAFRKAAKPAPDLAEQVDRLLEDRALEALSLANKAGQVVAGFAKVDGAVKSGHVVALVHAAEAAEDGVRKLAAVAKAMGRPVETIRLFSGEQLDLALGRPNVVHAALIAGDVSRLALERAAALARYRAVELEGPEPGTND
jgi:predicted RNA-binding protein YlxR (DUF448 family)